MQSLSLVHGVTGARITDSADAGKQLSSAFPLHFHTMLRAYRAVWAQQSSKHAQIPCCEEVDGSFHITVNCLQ